MAIESISSTPAYSAVQTVQASTAPQPVKSSEQTAKEGSNLQDISTASPQVDAQTASVAAASLEEDGNGGGHANTQEQQEKENEKIRKYIDDLSKKMNNAEVQFGIHDETNRVTIKMVDKQTKDVIKEFPPEKTLDMIAKVWEIAGLLVDEKR